MSVIRCPFITIIMPVRNEARFIRDTLGQLLEQDYPRDCFEIIVADGMSDDGTQDIVNKLSGDHPQVRLIENPKRLSSAARNVGFKNGKGDIFLVVDGHCYIPGNQLFNNIADAFKKSGANCLGRPQPLDPPGLSDFQKAVALARNSRIGHSGNSLIYSDYEGYASPVSNGAAYKREIFKTIGYVDESFDACEDVEFNYRVEKAGLKAYTSPSLAVKYYPRENLKSLLKQMIRYGQGRFKFIKKHPETFNLDTLVPSAFTLGLFLFIFFGLLSFFSSPMSEVWSLRSVASALLSIIYGLYFLIIVGESFRISFKKRFGYFRYLPFIFFAVHFGLGYGFIKEVVQSLVRSPQSVMGTRGFKP